MDKILVFVLILFLILPNMAFAQVNGSEVASQLSASNPLNGFLNFVGSNYFIWFWVLVVIAAFFIPFGIMGLKTFFTWVDKTFIKPKQGFIIVRQYMPNDQVIEFYAKPTGEMIKIKDWKGKPIDVPVKLGKDWSKFNGNMPVIEIDENCHQKATSSDIASPMSQEEITKGLKAAFEAGLFLGPSDFFARLEKLILIVIVVTAIGAGINAFFGYTNSQALSPNNLANAYHTAIVNTSLATSTVTVGAGG